MIVDVRSVNVRGYDRLNFISKVLSNKSLCYLVSKFGCDILLICKTHNIVNRFYSSFA